MCARTPLMGPGEWGLPAGWAGGATPAGWEGSARRVRLAPGDLVALFSDGITEAAHGEDEFGEPRLIEELRARSGDSPDAIVSGILGAVGEFVPAFAPYAARLGDRLLTAADPVALAPLLEGRLRDGDLVVLKASRGVALERILPALTVRANPPR